MKRMVKNEKVCPQNILASYGGQRTLRSCGLAGKQQGHTSEGACLLHWAFSVMAMLTLWAGSRGACSVFCRMFTSIAGFYPLTDGSVLYSSFQNISRHCQTSQGGKKITPGWKLRLCILQFLDIYGRELLCICVGGMHVKQNAIIYKTEK